MSDEMNNEVEATETTEASQIEDVVLNDMPLPEGLGTAGAKGDDSVLNTLLGVIEQQEEEPSEPVEPEDSTEEFETSEPEVEAETETVEETPVAETGDDYERAMAALLRDGTPRHILDEEYERNPNRFVEWGLKRAKVQSDGDRFSQEHAELKAKLDATQHEEGQVEGEVTAGNTPADQTQPANDFNVETQRAKIADIFGEEAADAVLQPIKSLTEELKVVLGQQQQRLFQISQMMEQKEVSSVRTQLQERFPQLADDEAFNTVREKMEVLAKTGQYNTYHDVMLDAARISFADAMQSKTVAAKINQAKSAGQPKQKSTASTATRPKTLDDRDDQVLESLMSGMSLNDVAQQFKS
jgi:DNA-binding NarL/FixJ family response regulator